MDWKPDVCWQVPLRLEEFTEDDGHVVSFVREWKRRDWGEGGADFHWWCTDDSKAFVGDHPVYKSLKEELVEEAPAQRSAVARLAVEGVSVRGNRHVLRHAKGASMAPPGSTSMHTAAPLARPVAYSRRHPAGRRARERGQAPWSAPALLRRAVRGRGRTSGARRSGRHGDRTCRARRRRAVSRTSRSRPADSAWSKDPSVQPGG